MRVARTFEYYDDQYQETIAKKYGKRKDIDGNEMGAAGRLFQGGESGPSHSRFRYDGHGSNGGNPGFRGPVSANDSGAP